MRSSIGVTALADCLVAERGQWGLWLPVGFAAGIGAYFALPMEPERWMGYAAGAAALALTLVVRGPGRRAAALALLVLAAGFTVAQARTHALSAPVIAKRMGPLQVSGTVVEIGARGHRLVLENLTVAGLAPAATPARLRLSIKGRATVATPGHRPGDRVRALAIIGPPPPPAMPGAFDFQRRAYFQGIGAYGFALGPAARVAVATPEKTTQWRGRRFLEAVRVDITETLLGYRDDAAGAVAGALLTGKRGAIPEETLADMRDAGIAHLLAISGLHIGLVAGLLFAAVRLAIALVPWLALRINGKKVAAVAAIAAAFGYALLAGFTVPTERAFLMTGLMLVGILLDRRALSLRSVAWAAMVVMVLRPESLVEPGFQMSFAAVTALIAAHAWISARRDPSVRRRGGIAGTALRYLGGVTLTTLIASAATAPFALYHFQHVAALGIVANLIAVPLAAFWVMPAGLLTLAGYLAGLAEPPFRLMSWGVELILETADVVAEWPLGAFDLAPPPTWALTCLVLGGLWLALWQRPWRLAGVPLILLGLVGPAFAEAPDLVVEGRGRLAAVRTADGGWLLSSPRAGFEARIWQRRSGARAPPAKFPTSPERVLKGLRCDAHACTLSAGPLIVAIARDAAALADDCRRADFVVALIPVRGPCPAPLGVVDRFDLWRGGTHAITLDDDRARITTVNGARGRRPWVVRPD